MSKLLTGSAKTNKSIEYGYLNKIMYLESGVKVCPNAILAGCLAPCLKSSGRMKFATPKQARKNRTELFNTDKEHFFIKLSAEIYDAKLEAKKLGLKLCVRLNGTSDIEWQDFIIKDEKNIFELFSDIQFYDYSKVLTRRTKHDNYHIIYSYSGVNLDYAKQCFDLFLKEQKSIAVVFDEIPPIWQGFTVIDGDKHDLRFLDPSNSIIGLKAKGEAIKENKGFVVKVKK